MAFLVNCGSTHSTRKRHPQVDPPDIYRSRHHQRCILVVAPGEFAACHEISTKIGWPMLFDTTRIYDGREKAHGR